MLKLVLIFLIATSSLFAHEIFKKDAEQFKATINFENKKEGAKITLKAIPKKGWHINDGFPVSFKPKETCLKFDKKKYKKKDTKTLKETELLFEIPTKCSNKGKEELDATIVLGVCTDKICKRVQFKVNASLESPINKKAQIKKQPKKTDIKK